MQLFKIRIATITGLLLLSMFCWANNAFEVIQLHHRSANSIIPVIQPMLSKDDQITGMDYQLLVKADPQTMEMVKRAILQLDKPARNLLIQVKLSNHYQNNRVHIYGDSGGLARDANEAQNIRVLDGHSAYVKLGREVPSEVIYPNGAGNPVVGTQYREMISGFYVTPHLAGQQVKLTITQQLQTPSQVNYNTIRSQSTSSTISVPLAQWVPLAGSAAQSQTRRDIREIGTSKTYSVFVKVSVLP